MLVPLLVAAYFSMMVSAQTLVAPEKALAKHLLSRYDELGVVGRPVANINDAVPVEVGFNLHKIIKADKSELTVSALLSMQWTDPFLAWDPAAFGGATSIALPADSIWKPDISIWNFDNQENDNEGSMADGDADVLVDQNGHVIWVPMKNNHRAACVDDTIVVGQKTCTFIGGSWIYDTSKLTINVPPTGVNVDNQLFQPTAGMELLSHSGVVEEKMFSPVFKYHIFKYSLVVKKTTQCSSKDGTKCNKS